MIEAERDGRGLMRGRVEILNGPNRGLSHPLEAFDRIIIGRGANVQLDLEGDATVSRMHAVLEFTPDYTLLRDMDSLNGTKVNGEKITEALLRSSDVLQIGKHSALHYFDERSDREDTTRYSHEEESTATSERTSDRTHPARAAHRASAGLLVHPNVG